MTNASAEGVGVMVQAPVGGGDEGGGPVAELPVTLTVMLMLPVLPTASRTEAVTVCGPFGSEVHGSVTGPRAEVVSVPVTRPSTLSVKVLDEPLVPSTHTTAVSLPRTVAPPSGCVMETSRDPPPPAGGAGVLDPVAMPLIARESVSPSTVKLTLPAKVPAVVGRKRATTAWVAPGPSENDPPETMVYGAPTLAVPDTAAVLVFCTVNVRSAVAPVARCRSSRWSWASP